MMVSGRLTREYSKERTLEEPTGLYPALPFRRFWKAPPSR